MAFNAKVAHNSSVILKFWSRFVKSKSLRGAAEAAVGSIFREINKMAVYANLKITWASKKRRVLS